LLDKTPPDLEIHKRRSVASPVPGRDPGPVTRKIRGIRTDSATDLQHPLSPPLFEFREFRDVRFHAVFPGFHFIKIFPRSYLLRRMPDVARPLAPVVSHPLDFNFPE
jgi:hypothetical protein